MNIFGTVLTHKAPFANYYGEGDGSSTSRLQSIYVDDDQQTIISSESIKNAMREIMIKISPDLNLNINRTRIHDGNQLAVSFKTINDPEKYIDDFIMGYLMNLEKEKKDTPKIKRTSVFQCNLAVSTEHKKDETIFHQSPWIQFQDGKTKLAREQCDLFQKEVIWTAFQYPFQINCSDFKNHLDWLEIFMMYCIGQLTGVAGNQTRSLFGMEPESIFLRISKRSARNCEEYCFDKNLNVLSLVDKIKNSQIDARELIFGGSIVSRIADKDILSEMGVKFHYNIDQALHESFERGISNL